MSNVVAVILAHDAMGTLPDVVRAIRDQTVALQLIIAVDNGSSDGTAEWLSQQPDLGIVTLHQNLGVGAGHNRGWAEALALVPSATHLWVLEHDTIPQEDCLERLLAAHIAASLRGERIGGVCPLQVRPGDQPPSTPPGPPARHRTLTFNGPLLLAAAVQEVGPVREDFIVGHEDREYELRLADYGYEVLRDSAAVVFHRNKGARRRGRPSVVRSYYANRNEAYLLVHVRRARWARLTVGARTVGATWRTLRHRQTPQWARIQARWRASFDGLRGDLGWKQYSFLAVDGTPQQARP